MEHASSYCTLWSLEDLSAPQAAGLLALARALQRDVDRGRPLAGRHVAVLCEPPGTASCEVFAAAATALGAQVVRIDPKVAGLLSRSAVRQAAPWLGRLYDAIQCNGMSEECMRELAEQAGVPVYNAVAACGHPTRLLADLMALQDDPRRATGMLELGVVETGRPRWRDAWSRVAALAGVAIHVVDVGGSGAQADGSPRADFVCDTAHPLDDEGHPALRAVSVDGDAPASLAAAQRAHHGFVVQALLSTTVV